VLTIDPARRLADSLGVKLGSEVVNVRPDLDALMLDTKAALDELVGRYATTPESLQRILRSRFYEQLSDAFAGSEEFVAMGTLHDLAVDGRYETIVVDTPPSRHAVEFLKVNAKLLRVYESGVVRYLVKPTKFLRMGGGYVANLLGRWTTSEYVEEFAEFMTTFDQMFLDLEARVRTMHDLLNDPSQTSLNIVAAPEEESVRQTGRLYDEVTRELHLPVQSCIVNRTLPPLPSDATHPIDTAWLAPALGITAAEAHRFARDVKIATDFYATLQRDQAKYVAQLRHRLPVPFRLVPAQAGSVHDLAGLEKVRASLFT
jgi:anion-transporting  ArsA/GET3 family ATPase